MQPSWLASEPFNVSSGFWQRAKAHHKDLSLALDLLSEGDATPAAVMVTTGDDQHNLLDVLVVADTPAESSMDSLECAVQIRLTVSELVQGDFVVLLRLVELNCPVKC